MNLSGRTLNQLWNMGCLPLFAFYLVGYIVAALAICAIERVMGCFDASHVNDWSFIALCHLGAISTILVRGALYRGRSVRFDLRTIMVTVALLALFLSLTSARCRRLARTVQRIQMVAIICDDLGDAVKDSYLALLRDNSTFLSFEESLEGEPFNVESLIRSYSGSISSDRMQWQFKEKWRFADPESNLVTRSNRRHIVEYDVEVSISRKIPWVDPTPHVVLQGPPEAHFIGKLLTEQLDNAKIEYTLNQQMNNAQ